MFDFIKKLFGMPTMQDRIDNLEKVVSQKEAEFKAAAKEEVKEVVEKVEAKIKKNVKKAAKKVAE